MKFIDKLMKKIGWVRDLPRVEEDSYFGVTISWLNEKEEVLASYEPHAAMLVGDSISVDILPSVSLGRLEGSGRVSLDDSVMSDLEKSYKISVDEFLKKIKYIRMTTRVR